MDLLVTALGAAGMAGAVAIGVTVAIERWGGVRGGLLGTVPTTIVPFSLGLEAEALRQALWAVPVGMLVNALFLLVWRELPPRLPARGLRARLAMVLAASLATWAVAAGSAVLALRALRAGGTSLFLPGLAAFVALLLGGAITSRARVPAPAGKRPVGPLTLFLRGSLAATAIGSAVLLQRVAGEVVAGMVAVFPAIFLTAMVGLWLAQGEAVPSGAVGPMVLGSSAVSGYALLAAWTMPMLGAPGGAACAWLGAVVGVTLPAAAWLNATGRTPATPPPR